LANSNKDRGRGKEGQMMKGSTWITWIRIGSCSSYFIMGKKGRKDRKGMWVILGKVEG
jgi:hypothetical protein